MKHIVDRSCSVGLLGGSFNPAHGGHVHISCEAYKHLGLDEIWWLVSPQNPLKSPYEMARLDKRLERSRELTSHIPYIYVTALELELGTQYTADTIKTLQQRFHHIQFTWIMGADNLQQFHRWHRWKWIAEHVPIAVFNRKPHTYPALNSLTAQRYSYARLDENDGKLLPFSNAPAWTFFNIRPNTESSTAIRQKISNKTIEPL